MNPGVWICLGMTLAAIVRLSWLYTLTSASTRWPSVEGRIVKSCVEKVYNGESYSYSPNVEYTYKVNGLLYGSDVIRLTGRKLTYKHRARVIVSRYETGSMVPVWYDPEDPARATLKTGGAPGTLAGLMAVSLGGPIFAVVLSDVGRRILGLSPRWFELLRGTR